MGVSLKSELPLRYADFTSVTAFNGFDNDQVTDDTDGLIYGPLFGLSAEAFLAPLSFSDWSEQEKRFYQELRLSSRTASGTSWTAGAVYFRSDFDVRLDNRSTFSPFLNGDRDAEQKIDSWAGFSEITSPLSSPRLTGTLGVRFSRDEKSLAADYQGVGFPGTVPNFSEASEANFDLLTGRAALVWKASDLVNVYATVARGAKSGGFPRFTLSAAIGAQSRSYAESTSWTYEGASGPTSNAAATTYELQKSLAFRLNIYRLSFARRDCSLGLCKSRSTHGSNVKCWRTRRRYCAIWLAFGRASTRSKICGKRPMRASIPLP